MVVKGTQGLLGWLGWLVAPLVSGIQCVPFVLVMDWATGAAVSI